MRCRHGPTLIPPTDITGSANHRAIGRIRLLVLLFESSTVGGTADVRNVVVGQAGASASCMEAANASGPCSAAAGSIHMTCQPWPSRSKKLREYMKP